MHYFRRSIFWMDWEQSVANKINEVYYRIVDYYVILNGEPMVHNQK